MAPADPRGIALSHRAGLVRHERAGMASHPGWRRPCRPCGPPPGDRAVPVDPDAVPDRDRRADGHRARPAMDDHRALGDRRRHRRALDAVVSVHRAVDRRARSRSAAPSRSTRRSSTSRGFSGRRSPACSSRASARRRASSSAPRPMCHSSPSRCGFCRPGLRSRRPRRRRARRTRATAFATSSASRTCAARSSRCSRPGCSARRSSPSAPCWCGTCSAEARASLCGAGVVRGRRPPRRRGPSQRAAERRPTARELGVRSRLRRRAGARGARPVVLGHTSAPGARRRLDDGEQHGCKLASCRPADPHLLGQTVSLYMLAMRGGMSLGSLLTGGLVGLLGVREALLLNGLLAVLTQAAVARAWSRAPLLDPRAA